VAAPGAPPPEVFDVWPVYPTKGRTPSPGPPLIAAVSAAGATRPAVAPAGRGGRRSAVKLRRRRRWGGGPKVFDLWSLVRIRFRQVGALRCAGASSRLAGDDYGLPGALRDRVRLPGLPGRLALAGGLSLPGLRRAPRVGARAAPPVGVRGLSPADVGDRGHGHARHAHVASAVVLGRLPGGHSPSGDLGQAAAAPARPLALRERLADPAEAAAGDGGARARAAAGRGRGRRVLPRWARGGPERRAPARKESAVRRGSRGSRPRLGPASPGRPVRRLRALARRVRRADHGCWGDRPHRRLAGLQGARRARL
jgi:hypothetical protein